ncbi:ABC transporter substrate-binding protein [Paenibacillus soyae]|uniref:Extracellular solute-binding protein n=1 Tax=Paenibacillus soyae TaxID=2969249 RepID=A0A9X2MR99_9BACL|nr:extracellular solute-binding protein [Paenibacillus soyae]MCR2804316.1 extracellular solute-binding protein [Paenibacillus soyae]
MKKGYTLIIVLLALMTSATACGSWRPDEQDAGVVHDYREVTLSLRHTQIKETSQTRLRVLTDVVNQTMEENKGVTITMEGIDEKFHRDTKLKQEMAAGNPPDIFEVFGGADLMLYVKADRMLDLTPILEELGLTDQFASLEEFTINGKVYGIPYGGYSEGIFYNKKIFAELGLDIPKTWGEMMAAAETIKQANYVPFAMAAKDAWVAGMMWNTIMERYVGIDAFNQLVTGETKWTDPQFIKGFKAFQEIARKDYFPGASLGIADNALGSQLVRGQAAMVFTGTWDVNQFTGGNAGSLNGHIGFFTFPSIPEGLGDQRSINASYSNGFGFSSTLSEDQVEIVKKFIANFFNENVQKRALMEDKLLPSMKLSDLSGIDPLMNEVLTVMSQASSSWPAFDAIVQPIVTAEIGVGLQELIGSLNTPEQVAENIQAVQDKANAAERNTPGLITLPVQERK